MSGHGHVHPHPGTSHRHHADGGPVVLDVGGEIGALVLHASASHVGDEIEISPVKAPERRSHVAVHPRDVDGRTVYAAVYPELLEDTYQLWSPSGEPVLEVSIAGGRVVEATWPA